MNTRANIPELRRSLHNLPITARRPELLNALDELEAAREALEAPTVEGAAVHIEWKTPFTGDLVVSLAEAIADVLMPLPGSALICDSATGVISGFVSQEVCQ